jgi:AmmeMemoRadiSam system protein A
MIDELERLRCLRLARDAIVAHVTGTVLPPAGVEGTLELRAGAFVTLLKEGKLRGCIGHVEPDEPLGRTIPRCAVASCSADPRFPPVAPEELPAIHIELSLLGPLVPVASVAEIELGRHGIVVEMNGRRALLLPQVATEWSWDLETFLGQTCRKADLSPDAWRHGARLWRFEADVFGEIAR